ncbi:Tkl/shk protein kinase, partial [Globisporangium splendens]
MDARHVSERAELVPASSVHLSSESPLCVRHFYTLVVMEMATETPMPSEVVAAIQASVVHRFRMLLVALTIGYGMIFLLSTALLLYMRHNRSVAFRGDASAARKIILPAFQPLLWLFSLVSLTFTLYFLASLTLTDIKVTASKVETEAYYSGRLFVMIVAMVYIHQKSVTTPALQRAVAISLLLCTYNLPIVWYTSTYASASIAYYVPMFTRLPMPLLFIWACISPPARASKQAIREYSVFVLIYYVLFATYSELFYESKVDAGFTVCFLNIFWGSLCPLVIWRTLKADTEHWRGLGQRACLLQTLFRQKHNLDERISSRGLHVLIEMHRKYIIDFAYLELKERIGVGSSAVVLKGVLHSNIPVAIKVYTPHDLIDETVAEFSHEAALCGALHHPNIVKFHGMCVCPPTICLVSELCQGSLDDITRALARRKHDARRQQLLINLQYMIDATRAVAYLHSFSPAFLHRDIKPANFLVDAQCVVKLTDFGESRSLPKATLSNTMMRMSTTSSGAGGDVWVSMPTPTSTPTMPERNAMTVRGTADYMAPELINGKAGQALYGEAADVYSLAITLWDIMHPLDEKYPEANGNHFKIFDAVLNGKRPTISDSCHPEVTRILAEAWEGQPNRRPSAQYILSSLEKLKEELSCDVAMALAETIEKKVIQAKKGGPVTTEQLITGQLLMQRMLEFDFVETVEEASRLGNGLMSDGYLHHSRHQEPFYKTTESFFFDHHALIRYVDMGAVRRLLTPTSIDKGKGTRVAGISQYPKHHVGDAGNPSLTSTMADSVVGERSRLSSISSKLSAHTHYVRDPHNKEPQECPCRKLGRGLGQVRGQRRRFRRNKKWYAIVEESILTENLLTDELDHTGESTYDDSPTNASDMEAAILHDSDDDIHVAGESEDDHSVNNFLKTKSKGSWAVCKVNPRTDARNKGERFPAFAIFATARLRSAARSPETHASFREVIVSAWHQDPRLRSSAQNIVSILESIQEEVLASFAAQLGSELVGRGDEGEIPPPAVVSSSRSGDRRQPLDRSFSGHDVIEYLTKLEYVAFPGEAIRMGNPLADAELLRYVKHARSFEDADAERYYFDDDHIQLCQLLNVKDMTPDEAQTQRRHMHADERAETMTATSATASATRRSHITQRSGNRSCAGSSSLYSGVLLLENGGLCACRKFWQRLEIAKSSRRRFRRNHRRQNHQELNSQFDAITEESVITTQLLMGGGDDATSAGEGDSGDFDEFDSVVVNVIEA